jgi:hypothetical protein
MLPIAGKIIAVGACVLICQSAVATAPRRHNGNFEIQANH